MLPVTIIQIIIHMYASLIEGHLRYIKDNSQCYRSTDLESENIESLWLRVKTVVLKANVIMLFLQNTII